MVRGDRAERRIYARSVSGKGIFLAAVAGAVAGAVAAGAIVGITLDGTRADLMQMRSRSEERLDRHEDMIRLINDHASLVDKQLDLITNHLNSFYCTLSDEKAEVGFCSRSFGHCVWIMATSSNRNAGVEYGPCRPRSTAFCFDDGKGEWCSPSADGCERTRARLVPGNPKLSQCREQRVEAD